MINVDASAPLESGDGFRLYPGLIAPDRQRALARQVMELARTRGDFRRQVTPSGAAMSVEMTSLGDLGWTSDRRGYRYEPRDPLTKEPWPAIPDEVLDIWRRTSRCEAAPDSCLVNLYRGGARMGLHQDKDEADLSAPVVSISLGDTAIFRLGGRSRRDGTRSIRLASGDVCVLDGAARLAFHGVDRILPGSSNVVEGGGRLNLTLRRAGPLSSKAA